MARNKAGRSVVRGKRVPLLIMVVHAKPMPQRAMKRGKPSKSKR